MKGWWFKLRGKKIIEEIGSESEFSFSDGWFKGLKSQFHLSVRRATNTCQREPKDKQSTIQTFHQQIRRMAVYGQSVGPLGQWKPENIANMDRTPLPFAFLEGETYAERSVWVRGAQSGLKKGQCTVQLTIFADGEPRVKPMLIFKGKGDGLY